MPKMMNPNTTLWWVPEGGFVDPANPTAEEINAGTNVSAAIVTGFTLNPTDSDTDDSRSIVDEGNVENPTWDNYEGNFTAFRDSDPAAESAMNDFYTLFKEKGARGWWVRRLGKKYTVDAAAGDTVSLFLFQSDNPQDVAGGDEGPIQMTVPFLQQGAMHLNREVGAATP